MNEEADQAWRVLAEQSAYPDLADAGRIYGYATWPKRVAMTVLGTRPWMRGGAAVSRGRFRRCVAGTSV